MHVLNHVLNGVFDHGLNHVSGRLPGRWLCICSTIHTGGDRQGEDPHIAAAERVESQMNVTIRFACERFVVRLHYMRCATTA